MTAPLSCTRHKDCRLRRAALRRAEPSEANEWRAVRGGAHGVGAGVGDDDGAPVLHTIQEASGRQTASRNPRSRRRCDGIAARDSINQHRNPPKSGCAVTRQGGWCGAARRRSGAREAQAGVPHSDCPTTLLQEDGRVKLAIAHVNECDVHRNLSRSTTTAHIQNRS
jgi:hypothetical protein